MKPDRRVTLGLSVVGSFFVSTLDDSPLDPEWERIEDLLLWVYTTRHQADRLKKAMGRSFPFFIDPRRVEQEKASCRTVLEEHTFVIAAANLSRAIQRSGKRFPMLRPPKRELRALWLLRNVYEHWDGRREVFRSKGGGVVRRSAKKLQTEFPDAKPWKLEITPEGDVLIGCVVSLGKLTKALRSLEAGIRWERRRLRRLGKHLPAGQSNKTLKQTTSPAGSS